jgi:hypothetical protein
MIENNVVKQKNNKKKNKIVSIYNLCNQKCGNEKLLNLFLLYVIQLYIIQ